MFYDVNAVPKPGGGTVADTIAQPCAKNSPNCVASVKKDQYGLLSSSKTSQVAAYPVGGGYDLATGLGSMNFANLVNGWTVSGSPAAATSSPTTTTLTAAPTTIPFGGQTTLTATVTNSTFSSPTGTVQFYVGGVAGRLLGTATLVAGRAPSSTATLGVVGSALNPGANDLVAVFSGDGANDAASTSASVRVNVGLTALATSTTTTITGATETVFFPSLQPRRTVKQYTTLTAHVTATSGNPNGTVQFLGGTQPAWDGGHFPPDRDDDIDAGQLPAIQMQHHREVPWPGEVSAPLPRERSDDQFDRYDHELRIAQCGDDGDLDEEVQGNVPCRDAGGVDQLSDAGRNRAGLH